MKAIIVYVFAVAAIVNGQTGFLVQSNAALTNHRENPYGYLLRTRRDEQICTPGDTKQEDCNSCYCVSDGTGWGCTRMECVPEDSDYLSDAPSNPLQRTKRDLGSHSGSPLKHLLRVVRSEQICTPDETRQEDCNTCVCVSDGTEWGCTRMACVPE